MQKKCYKLVTAPFGANWDVADAGCKSIGAELASIESQCEQNTVFEVSNKVATWTGGNDKSAEGTFVWPNGVEFYTSSAAVSGVFTKLSNGFNSASQSTQACVSLKDTTGEWDDIVCSKAQNYVCEKAAYVGGATFVPASTVAATTKGNILVEKLYHLNLLNSSMLCELCDWVDHCWVQLLQVPGCCQKLGLSHHRLHYTWDCSRQDWKTRIHHEFELRGGVSDTKQ